MFWRVAGYAQASPIEGILDKESFTLEELLDEDGIIQVPAGLQPAAEPSMHASHLQECRRSVCQPALPVARAIDVPFLQQVPLHITMCQEMLVCKQTIARHLSF